ncbi:hypothetical protein [Cesiribacter sp. SM1]|uniref:hypothetical protein n=1 Tax=Cesiribacter sp. SM1 TaxID=2861196 RepID=UPI001CD245E9|nr:hypothetical protein [Cesiribacter sp. SM1]
MSFRKILFIVIPSVLLVSAIIYWLLGGFKSPQVEVVAVEGGYTLVGKHYLGTLKHPALQDILDEVGQRWESGQLPGVLTVAVLKEPVTDKDTVEQFIGVLLPATEQLKELPEGYEIMEVEAQRAIRVSLDAHSSVWPTPDKLRQRAEEHARENGLAIQPHILLEKYYGPGHLEVELPLEPATSVR